MRNSKYYKQELYKWLKRGTRWLIGIVIFYFVFQNIDFAELKMSIEKSNPWLFFLGLAHAPLFVIIAALRWRFLLMQYYKRRLPVKFVLNHYWKGLALSSFTPAFIGLDAYRFIISGRYFGEYTLNTAVILVEKLMALITCMTIIVILYPIVPISLTPEIERVFYLVYFLFFVSILILLGIIIILRNKISSLFLEKFEDYITSTISKILDRCGFGDKLITVKFSFKTIIEPLSKPGIIFVIIFSFGIQLISSVKSQIFFCALGYDLSFLVNLFVAPTLYFIFLLPVSIGSFGIREGVYILLYGLFGVPTEIALLVSFFNLFGMMLNSLIGGIIMMLTRSSKELQSSVQ